MRTLQCLILIGLLGFGVIAQAEVDRMKPGAPNPHDAIKTFELPEGFVIELVAAEPLVLDPVAFAWGPDGKLWVVEMADYNHLPANDKSDKKPHGRVVYLTDSNHDGRYDKRHVFLDDLNYPNGVLPWRNGVLITAAPDILFAADNTPNDDNFKADKREVLYTGFHEGNPQLRINGLRWGLDNWIYCANGLSHGKVKSMKTGKVIDIRNRDVRIRPDTGELEHATGPSQFGRVRDDYGNWFGCNNSDLIRQYVLPDHYLRRNPHVKYPDPVISLVTPRNPPLFAQGQRVERFHAPYMAGRFTSACGLHIYRDTLLDAIRDSYYHNAFVCEPVHNLVTRRVLLPEGVTFKAVRAKSEAQREWLTSSDNWFRPAMVRTAPDGTIWIADMYRAVIEHAQWAPKEVHDLFALRHGKDRGRIFRVYRKANVATDRLPTKPDEFRRATTKRHVGPGVMPGRPALSIQLDRMKEDELIPLLADRNGYVRDLASMALLWRDNLHALLVFRDKHLNFTVPQTAAVEKKIKWFEKAMLDRKLRIQRNRYLFTDLLIEGKPGKSDLGRLHAMCVLDAMKELEPGDLKPILNRSNPDVFDHQIRLSGSLEALSTTTLPRDRKQRMQLAFSLGEHDAPKAGALLSRIMLASKADPYVQAAVMSSARPHLAPLTNTLLKTHDPPSDIIESLATMVVAEKKHVLLLATIDRAANRGEMGYSAKQCSIVAALLDAMARRGQTLQTLAALPGNAQWSGASKVQAMVTWITDHRNFNAMSPKEQAEALRLFGRLHATRDSESRLIADLLKPDASTALQRVAVNAITRQGDEAIRSMLLNADRWKSFTPTLRSRIVALFLQRTSRITILLDAVKAGTVQPVEIDTSARQRLVTHKSPAVRDRAKKLLGDRQTDRGKLVEQFADVAKLQGDTARGRTLFTKACAACHRLAGEGQGVAPDLSSLTDRSTGYLLKHILDPNAAVDSRYINYVCETEQGDTFTGMLVSETGGSLTIVGPNGDKHVILRKDVFSLRSTNLSLMPEGLEKELSKLGEDTPGESKQALADVIAYVQHRSQPPRALPIKPRIYKPAGNGSIVLTCRNLEAFGTTVNYEKQDNNIGNWISADDYLVWQIDGAAAGEYDVWFDYAAENAWQGNTFMLAALNQISEVDRLQGEVQSTGSQDRYEQRKVGRLQLAAGAQRITLRAAGKVNGELMDLRGVRLVPVK